MEQIQLNNFEQDPETLVSDSSFSRLLDGETIESRHPEHRDSTMEEADESLSDSMVCDSSSTLIPTGFRRSDATGYNL